MSFLISSDACHFATPLLRRRHSLLSLIFSFSCHAITIASPEMLRCRAYADALLRDDLPAMIAAFRHYYASHARFYFAFISFSLA